MRQRQSALLGLVALASALLGGLGVAALLIGPGGYRPAASTAVTHPTPMPSFAVSHPTPTPSLASATATPTPQADLPSPRTYASMAFDAATGELVLFGGCCDATGRMEGDTWTWNGQRWTLMEKKASDPLPRASATMAYDPVHRNVVMRGGISNDNVLLDETWTWDGKQWVRMTPQKSPPVLAYAVDEPLVWDADRKAVLLFAFTRNGILTYDVPDLNQLWSWDGADWTQLSVPGAPSGLGENARGIAYDTARKVLVFLGYGNSSRYNSSTTPTTWTFDGKTWATASNAGPIANQSAYPIFAMVADEARANIVVFTWNLNTWTWNGTTWTQVNPVHSPSGLYRAGAATAYDSARKVVVLFGGSVQGGLQPYTNDLWAWNGTDWTRIA